MVLVREDADSLNERAVEHRKPLEDIGGGGGRSGHWNASSLEERTEDVVVQAKEEVADVTLGIDLVLLLPSNFYFASSVYYLPFIISAAFLQIKSRGHATPSLPIVVRHLWLIPMTLHSAEDTAVDIEFVLKINTKM